MKKTVLVLALLAGIVAFVLFAYKVKKTNDEKKAALKLPPAATPPIVSGAGIAGPNNGLYDPKSGSGLAAIERRAMELQGAVNELAAIKSGLSVNADGLKNVQYIGDFIATNIATSTGGAGLELLPLILSPSQKATIKTVAELTYKGPGYWSTLERIVNALKALRVSTGVSLLPENAYNPKDLNPIRNGVVIKLIRRDAVAKGRYDTGRITDGTEKLIADLNSFAQNWLSLSDQFSTAIKEKAISDLRASGWRFIGYDAPV